MDSSKVPSSSGGVASGADGGHVNTQHYGTVYAASGQHRFQATSVPVSTPSDYTFKGSSAKRQQVHEQQSYKDRSPLQILSSRRSNSTSNQ